MCHFQKSRDIAPILLENFPKYRLISRNRVQYCTIFCYKILYQGIFYVVMRFFGQNTCAIFLEDFSTYKRAIVCNIAQYCTFCISKNAAKISRDDSKIGPMIAKNYFWCGTVVPVELISATFSSTMPVKKKVSFFFKDALGVFQKMLQ